MPRQNNDPRKPSQIETLLAVSIRVPIGGAGAGSTPLTGHHVEGGSLAEIFVARSVTRWLRL